MTIEVIDSKYDPIKIEGEIFNFWNENDIYKKVKNKNKGKQKFYFLDGPPYVTNPIHVGTAWNKIIKDIYLRYYRMNGYDVWDIPGYDMHGLPIEVQVEQILKFKTKKDVLKFGVDNFIVKCRNYALENLKIQENQFKNLGIWMDWDNPYMTIKNEYIEGVWYFIKKSHEKNLLYKGEKIVHWCPRCETVLANVEVTEEYRDKEDPSIYVKFKILNSNEYLLIWTTTPWTLPSNVAVAIHPNEVYVYAQDDRGEILIFAKKRIEDLEKETGRKFKILREVQGKKLEGLRYEHPLSALIPIQNKIEHKVILSEQFVTMLEGTGCVHIAPGHGKEDYELGRIYNLPMISPVDSSGKFTNEIQVYEGIYVFDANERIIEDLRKVNALYFNTKIQHRYPHCWRCKTPLILKLSEQWFLDVPKIRDELIRKALMIRWFPKDALENRVIPWLKNVHEWALSRQRFWGIPLPIWICSNCDNVIVIGSINELISHAINIPPNSQIDLHKPWIDKVEIKCTRCGGTARRIPDVLDVWVDSGAASWASLNYPQNKYLFEQLYPSDLVLEGPDQVRAWFYSCLVASTITFDQIPFKSVIIHGWSLDETGRAMHKSLGNVIYPEDVIQKYGRDSLRVYELMNTTWEDLKFSISALREVYRTLNIIWNTFYFASLYMKIDNFDATIEFDTNDLEIEDKWLFQKFEEIKNKIKNDFENSESFEALRRLVSFLVEDVSRWYIRIIRRRVWLEENAKVKLTAYYTLFRVLEEWLRMFGIFAPFMSEHIYQRMFRKFMKAESLHLLDWPKAKSYDSKLIDQMNIAREIVSQVLSLRMKRGYKLRRPLIQLFIIPTNDEVYETVQTFERIIKDQSNVKLITVGKSSELKSKFIETKIKLNYSAAGPKLKEKVKELSKLLDKLNPEEILESFNSKGYYEVELSSGKITLTKEMLNFEQKLKGEYEYAKGSNFEIFVDFTSSPELESELLVREIVRRIQMMRKLLNLNLTDRIETYISVPSDSEAKIIDKYLDYIKNETLSETIHLESKEKVKGSMIREWEIEEETYVIGVSKINK